MGFTWTGTEIVKYLSKKFELIMTELAEIKLEIEKLKEQINEKEDK
jgi:hypothetical protein